MMHTWMQRICTNDCLSGFLAKEKHQLLERRGLAGSKAKGISIAGTRIASSTKRILSSISQQDNPPYEAIEYEL